MPRSVFVPLRIVTQEPRRVGVAEPVGFVEERDPVVVGQGGTFTM
jgi:hypothetical protein